MNIKNIAYSLLLIVTLPNMSMDFSTELSKAADRALETYDAQEFAQLLSTIPANQRLSALQALRVQDEFGLSTLHCAAANGFADLIPILVNSLPEEQKSEYLNQQDPRGLTALHWAADGNHATAFKALIAAGAHTTITNQDGNSPIDIVIKSPGKPELKSFVIAHTLAMATHARIGTGSALATLPQHLLQDITHLASE